MSILIKGMEMPKDNDAVSIIIFPNGKVSLAHDRRFAEYAEAVPVPPHGRLIDADALLQSHSVSDGIYFPDAYIPATAIKAAPTIITAEEEKV